MLGMSLDVGKAELSRQRLEGIRRFINEIPAAKRGPYKKQEMA